MFLLYWLTAFLSGAGVLVVELAATKSIDPWFGQSTFVWTNVIGLILLGLAIGNVVGGMVADRTRSPTLLGILLVAAALLVGASGWLPALVARLLLPEDLPLEAAFPFLLRGSFVATFLCFFPPVVLLGAVPPFLVRCSARALSEVGSRSGVLYGASTIGSIAGTFATSYLLIPQLGTRGTLLGAAGMLAGAAVPLFLVGRGAKAGRRTGAVVGALAVAVVAFGAMARPEVRAAVPGGAMGRLVACRDSRYQHLEVRERDDLPVPARVLALDEGLDSYQSVAPAEGTLTGGLYYDVFTMLALERCGTGPFRVLVLGMGGGTHVRQLLDIVGPRCDLSIVGVEIDPEVVAIGREELGLPADPRLQVITDVDARPFVELCRRSFDFVIVDCYARQSFLPTHLVSREFFAAVRRRLEPRGVVALNVFGYGGRDPVVETVVRSVAAEFPEGVVVESVPRAPNFVVCAARDERPGLPSTWITDGWPAPLVALARSMSTLGAAWIAAPDPEMPALRDDDGGLELLQWRRLAEHARTLRESSR